MTSPAYRALWKRDIGSPLDSAIFCIFDSLSVLPVSRYRKERRSKFFVCWYAFSTIYVTKPASARALLYIVTTDLVVALLQTLFRKPFPAFWAINLFGHVQRHIQVSTFDRQVEPHILVLNEMQGNL